MENLELKRTEVRKLEESLKTLKFESSRLQTEVKKSLHKDFFFDAEKFEAEKDLKDNEIEEMDLLLTSLKMEVTEIWNIEYHSEKLEESKLRLKVIQKK